MKIYRTVNPVAYENTYDLENEHSLILVDPGSDWATIQKQIDCGKVRHKTRFLPIILDGYLLR